MNSPFIYQFLLAMRSEIDKHKWIESEKAGHDIGLELAMIDWVMKYKSGWKQYYIANQYSSSLIKDS